MSQHLPIVDSEAVQVLLRETKIKPCQCKSLRRGTKRHIGSGEFGNPIGSEDFSVQFKVLDIGASYNLLMGRPFIHMDGVVPSTLHQTMKVIWKDQELVIHDEGSHFVRQDSIIDEVSQYTNFYTVELVNAIGEGLTPQPPMHVTYKMIVTVMLQNGFDLGLRLGRNS